MTLISPSQEAAEAFGRSRGKTRNGTGAHSGDLHLPDKEGREECIAIFAPFGQDSLLLTQVLEPTARVLSVSSCQSFCELLNQCAVGVLTTEALNPEAVTKIKETLRDQPLWSDLPIVLLASPLDAASYALLVNAFGNVTVIERPLQASSLITVVQTALRARQKQYQIRDLLEAEERQTMEIKALNSRLQRAMTETHHRVKNSLQIISAFVEMQALEYDAVVPLRELRRINTHIKTLASVHEVLTKETKRNQFANHVSVKDLLEHLFPMLQSMLGDHRLLFEIEDIRLPSRQGTSLALVANELVLNAMKHNEGAQQEIRVSLRIRGSKAELTVIDNGPGFPDEWNPGTENTGLELIDSLVQWDLQGTVRYENIEEKGRRTGARVIVEFDLSQWGPQYETIPGLL